MDRHELPQSDPPHDDLQDIADIETLLSKLTVFIPDSAIYNASCNTGHSAGGATAQVLERGEGSLLLHTDNATNRSRRMCPDLMMSLVIYPRQV